MPGLSVYLVIVLLCCVGVLSSVVRYDQSQSGDVNIQVQLKNIEVFAILDDALLGEYGDYDYADFTEKPLKPSGSHNSSHANASSSHKPDDNLAVADIFYNIVSNVTSRPHTTASTSSTTTVSSTEATTTTTTAQTTTTTTTSTTTAKNTRRCGNGFFRDSLGRCRRIRRPHLPLLGLGYHSRNHKATVPEDVPPKQ